MAKISKINWTENHDNGFVLIFLSIKLCLVLHNLLYNIVYYCTLSLRLTVISKCLLTSYLNKIFSLQKSP